MGIPARVYIYYLCIQTSSSPPGCPSSCPRLPSLQSGWRSSLCRLCSSCCHRIPAELCCLNTSSTPPVRKRRRSPVSLLGNITMCHMCNEDILMHTRGLSEWIKLLGVCLLKRFFTPTAVLSYPPAEHALCITQQHQVCLHSRRLCSGVSAVSERWKALCTSCTSSLHCRGSSEGLASPALLSVFK